MARSRPRPRPGRRSTAKGVKRLPASAFAYPRTREYPINTPKRARAALAYASRSTTSGSYAHVARAVRRKYGNRIATVGPRRGTTTRPGYRKRRR